jgi:hypothetical protein
MSFPCSGEAPAAVGDAEVPFLFFLLLVLLIATVGFWKALAAP